MLKAIVDGCESLATPKAVGSCPLCDSQVIAKCGSMVVWHWAHASLADCDLWSEGETDWHAAWKSRFSRTEETITRQIGDSVVKHRADAVTSRGRVIEFQHSSISAEEIRERERFYGDMIWVIDGCEAFESNRIGLDLRKPHDGGEYVRFRWKSRKRSFDSACSPIFIDLGVSFKDVGDPMVKLDDWWDDSEGGLRDGIRRGSGVWNRTINCPLLLEVKKQTAGRGWGQLVRHDEFCIRVGESRVKPTQAQRGLRLCAERWDNDGYAYRTSSGLRMLERMYGKGSWHSWCREILNSSRDGVETT